jgi:hypothetical protein
VLPFEPGQRVHIIQYRTPLFNDGNPFAHVTIVRQQVYTLQEENFSDQNSPALFDQLRHGEKSQYLSPRVRMLFDSLFKKI